MKRIGIKLVSFAVTLFFVAILTFLMFRIIPGDAAIAKLGTDATPEMIEALQEEYGYDKNVIVRFFDWLGDAIRGDFGMSIRYSGKSVASLIGDRLSVTVWLAVFSLALIILISLPLGLWCAARPGGIIDKLSDVVAQVMMAIPAFVQGIIVTLIFGIVFAAFTPGAYISPEKDFRGFLGYLFFPALSVALPKIGMTIRFMKTSVREQRKEDYVKTAIAKGASVHDVMWQHIFKNSLLPVITFIGLIMAEVMAGSIMIEQVFNLPGLGRLLVTSISNRDFNVVQAIVMFIAVVVLFVNALVDILYKLIDPRV